jgi:DNA repair protein RadC
MVKRGRGVTWHKVFEFRTPDTHPRSALAQESHIRIKDLPAQERPRERLAENGAETLKTSELLAILIRTGSKGVSAVDLGERLLQQFGTLDRLARAPLADLQKVKGIGRDKAIALKGAFTLAQRMAREIRTESPVLDKPELVAELLREEMRSLLVETFHVLLLNTRRRLISVEKISNGTLDTILIHPREVFKAAIAANASAIVLAHNHPSGDPSPSEADIRATRDLIRAGQVLKIDVLDHVIIGTRSDTRPKDFVSLRDLGIFH